MLPVEAVERVPMASAILDVSILMSDQSLTNGAANVGTCRAGPCWAVPRGGRRIT